MLEPSQIDKMSVVERLQAMELLWDSLTRAAADMDSPEWHRDVLADRKARAAQGGSKFLSLDQIRTRLRGSQQ